MRLIWCVLGLTWGITKGIHGDTVQMNLIVQMGSRGATRVAHEADLVPPPDGLPFFYEDLLQVGILCDQPVAMLYRYHFTKTAVTTNPYHNPIRGRNHRGIQSCRDINPFMQFP